MQESFLKFLKCIKCDSNIVHLDKDGRIWCESCNHIFPSTANGIPVLLYDAIPHLVNTYMVYLKHIDNLKNQIESISGLPSSDLKYKDSIANGLSTNKQLFENLLNDVGQYLNINDVISVPYDARSKINYVTTLSYLQRDWSYSTEAEREVAAVVGTLKESLKNLTIAHECALFLGAATGRFVYELRQDFQNLIAVDKSITMASLFEKLKFDDICFYEVGTKNIHSKESRVHKVLINSQPILAEAQNIAYLISDANEMPVKDSSISLIASIYFTDVLPPGKLINEIKRMLKPGGILFHFGPLEYHFDEFNQMLSYEEFVELLQENEFEILKEENLVMPHCVQSSNKTVTYFHNWILTARKKETITPELTWQSVLIQNKELNFSIQGRILLSGEEDSDIHVILPSGEIIRNAKVLVEILRCTDGIKNLAEIFSQLKSIFEIDDFTSDAKFFNIVNVLIENKITKISV